MNPYGVSKPTTYTQADFDDWNAEVQRAADEVAAHHIITEPQCDNCGQRSRQTPCWKCEALSD